MADTFPFTIALVPLPHRLPERQYGIQADVGGLETHREVFEHFGYGGNGPSWEEHIMALVEEHVPELLDHLEFDCEADTFLVYADSQAATTQFTALICPIFAQPTALAKYFSQLDPSDFFE